MRNAADFPAGTDLKFQWDVFFRDPPKFTRSFMLNTDMELAYDIDVDNTGKGTQCKIGNGQDQSTCSIHHEYHFPIFSPDFRIVRSSIKIFYNPIKNHALNYAYF